MSCIGSVKTGVTTFPLSKAGFPGNNAVKNFLLSLAERLYVTLKKDFRNSTFFWNIHQRMRFILL